MVRFVGDSRRPRVPLIRPAAVSDYAAFAALVPELRVDDPTPSFEKFAAEICATTFVAEGIGGEVEGYCYYQVLRPEAYVRHVVVAERARGRRVGEALLLAVARLARAEGASRWQLNVKPDNAPALALYRRLGFVTEFSSTSLRFDWGLAARLPAPEGRAIACEPADDARVEAAAGLSPGMLAAQRALPHRVLRAVEHEGRILGAAVFNPTFPGAFPFRAQSPGAARTLLEALAPHALPEPPYMQVVVEGQPTLTAALVTAGATVRLEFLHLSGPLPAVDGPAPAPAAC